MKQTKIVATISDLRCDVDFLTELYNEGMNVARMNTAHITLESGKKMIENIRSVSEDIAIIVDTKGPEIRTCRTQKDLTVIEKEEVIFSYKPIESKIPNICVNYEHFVDDVGVDQKILIDDGAVAFTVLRKESKGLICKVENSGIVKKKKSINVPGVDIHLPTISKRDYEFIKFAAENDVDFIAHSFVRSKEDILKVQEELDKYDSEVKIIAKIENLKGISNIEEILEVTYGIMVARGDMGIELPPEKIPTVQRNLIQKAILHKKPVIIATQMLHSMIEQPRPTRAEVSDVAIAIYSRVDAIMLSGETAYGKYPVEAVKTMANIAKEVEPDRAKRVDKILPPVHNEIPAFLAGAALDAANKLSPKAIVTSTSTGKTARYVAAYRPQLPVYSICHSKRVVRELSLSFGIIPSYLPIRKNKLKVQKAGIDDLIERGILKMEDLIIYIGGNYGEISGASFVEISSTYKLVHKG